MSDTRFCRYCHAVGDHVCESTPMMRRIDDLIYERYDHAKQLAAIAEERDRLRERVAKLEGFSENACHVAWLRYSGTGAYRTINTCDSDDEGAFKVYRHTDQRIAQLERDLKASAALAKDFILGTPHNAYCRHYMGDLCDCDRHELIKPFQAILAKLEAREELKGGGPDVG